MRRIPVLDVVFADPATAVAALASRSACAETLPNLTISLAAASKRVVLAACRWLSSWDTNTSNTPSPSTPDIRMSHPIREIRFAHLEMRCGGKRTLRGMYCRMRPLDNNHNNRASDSSTNTPRNTAIVDATSHLKYKLRASSISWKVPGEIVIDDNQLLVRWFLRIAIAIFVIFVVIQFILICDSK